MDIIRPRRLSLLVLLLWTLILGACGTTRSMLDADGDPQAAGSALGTEENGENDPFERFNRGMFKFNQKVDKYALKPVAKGYRAIFPSPVRKGVSNFFSNLREPIVILNDLLQGKFIQAVSDLSRFIWNTTAGLYGLIDVASHMGMEKHDEDFGQTLGKWGAGEGPYLVLPFLGPSNIRDGAGLVVDYETYPPNHMEEQSTRDKLFLTETVNRRSQLLEAGDILEQAAGKDAYIFVREAYRQRRRNLIYDGNPPASEPPDFLFEDEAKPAPEDTAPAEHPPSTPPADAPTQ